MLITDDFEIAKEVFALLDAGIVDGYDSFEFTAVPHDEYMERELLVTLNGVQYRHIES